MITEKSAFDRTLREILQLLPKRFVELLFGVKVSEVLSPSFPRVKDRTVDFACRLETGKLVLVEIQTVFDKSLYLRMVDVYLRVIEKYAEFPIVILLWVGEKKCPYREVVNLGALRFKFTVKDLKKINCKGLLQSDDPYDVLLSMLCRRGKDFWSKLKEKVYLLPE